MCHLLLWLYHFTFPQAVQNDSSFSISLPAIVFFLWWPFGDIHLNECSIIFHCDFIFIFQIIICDSKYFYMCFLAFVYLIWKDFNSRPLSKLSCRRFLYILDPYQMLSLQAFSPISYVIFSFYWWCPLINKIFQLLSRLSIFFSMFLVS